MKQYTLAQLRADQSPLEELPIELVKYGKVIGVIYPVNVVQQLEEKQAPVKTVQNVVQQSPVPEETTQERPTQSKQVTDNVVQHSMPLMNGQKTITTCQHGAAMGLCRFGCKS